jgi:hypothetical protein
VADEQLPLLFFQPPPGADPLTAAESLSAGTQLASLPQLDPLQVLNTLKSTRGFARLKIALPTFTLDNPRLSAALEGTATPTHLRVHFHGDFDRLAQPLFTALTAQGLACYSVWDRTVLPAWPNSQVPSIDKGFATRMARITERKSLELRQTEPDPKRRARLLDAFLKSPEFRAEMANEARLEQPTTNKRHAKAYTDLVNCHARWRTGHPSASELAAVRKLSPALAALSLAELRTQIGTSPRLLLLTAVPPRQGVALRTSADQLGLLVDLEPP